MHPVLKSSLDPLVKLIETLSRDEAQVQPLPGQGRWCAQQIIEHLILTYKQTSDSLSRQLKTGRIPKSRRNVLEFILRLQTIGVGYMPSGVPAMRSVRPTDFDPEDGATIAARFTAAAEEMDGLLSESRRRFGIQACGEHPLYGVLRVDEWRRYHAVHAKHHRSQLREAIRYARTHKGS